MKGVCALIIIPAAMYIIFRGAFHQCLNDRIYSTILMILNCWTLLGILICTFMLAPEHQRDHKKLWLVFFVPTIGWYLCTPLYCSIKTSMDKNEIYFGSKNQPAKSEEPVVFVQKQHDSLPIFYARYPIKAGDAFTAKNLKVQTAEAVNFDGTVIANSESFFGEKGNANSILSHKAKRSINAGEAIKNSNVEPPFEDRFVLHRKD